MWPLAQGSDLARSAPLRRQYRADFKTVLQMVKAIPGRQ
jgi:hypothetical protein